MPQIKDRQIIPGLSSRISASFQLHNSGPLTHLRTTTTPLDLPPPTENHTLPSPATTLPQKSFKPFSSFYSHQPQPSLSYSRTSNTHPTTITYMNNKTSINIKTSHPPHRPFEVWYFENTRTQNAAMKTDNTLLVVAILKWKRRVLVMLVG